MTQSFIQIGDMVLNTREHVLLRGEEGIQLSNKQFELLHLFLSAPRTLITKDMIVDAIWDGRAISNSVITTSIKELRRAGLKTVESFPAIKRFAMHQGLAPDVDISRLAKGQRL